MYFCFPSNQYLSFHYPFRDPSITPWLKYFWTKGYIHIMGAEDTTITAYLIRVSHLLGFHCCRAGCHGADLLVADKYVPQYQLQRLQLPGCADKSMR